jgi:DNA polymerase III epsilon subunit family exonuclease
MSLSDLDWVALDLETTGFSPTKDRIVEIGAIRGRGPTITGETYQALINPGMAIPPAASKVNGITDETVADSPMLANVWTRFREFMAGSVAVAHYAHFDRSFIDAAASRMGQEAICRDWVCTRSVSRWMWPGGRFRHSLDDVLDRLGIPRRKGPHRGVEDARLCAEVWRRFMEEGMDTGWTVGQALGLARPTEGR